MYCAIYAVAIASTGKVCVAVSGCRGLSDAVSVSERCLMLSPAVRGLSDTVSVSERCLMLSPAVRGLSDTVSVSERCLMLSRYQSAV